MDKIEIFKALSNETRLSIIEWLKEPEKNFPPQGGHFDDVVDLKGGVCVGSIRDKAGISQSTVSHYLDMLQKQACFFPKGAESGHITDGMKRPSLRWQTTLVTKFKLCID